MLVLLALPAAVLPDRPRGAGCQDGMFGCWNSRGAELLSLVFLGPIILLASVVVGLPVLLALAKRRSGRSAGLIAFALSALVPVGLVVGYLVLLVARS